MTTASTPTSRHPFLGILCAWAIPALLLSTAIPARADWTRVRDMVQKAEQLDDRDSREAMLREAYNAAQLSLRAAPNSSNEHLWLAIAAGRLGVTSSNKGWGSRRW
jgi:hypothetical protein